MAGGSRYSVTEPLAALLASGMTIRAAAAKLGVSEELVYRRKRDPKFQVRVEALREQMITGVVGLLASNSVATVARLIKLRESTNETIALGACRAWLEFVFKGSDHLHPMKAIRQLEREVAAVIKESRLDPREIKGALEEDTDLDFNPFDRLPDSEPDEPEKEAAP